jgi:SAM-dependent methyltransferase
VSSPERIVPDETEPGIVAIHLKRYEFALPYCGGKEVLDAGCGVGYGTAELATSAHRVVGVDRSEDAVEYARTRYGLPNVEFRVGDVTALLDADASYDVVCSFETVEHLQEPEQLVQEAARVLRPGGVFVCSTPRTDERRAGPDNPFHEVELSADDFERLLRRGFDDIELYGQQRLQTARHRLMQRLDVLGLRRRLTFLRPAARRLLGTSAMADVDADGLVIERGALDDASELVAVCRK